VVTIVLLRDGKVWIVTVRAKCERRVTRIKKNISFWRCEGEAFHVVHHSFIYVPLVIYQKWREMIGQILFKKGPQ
jgi:fatty acid desaturase